MVSLSEYFSSIVKQINNFTTKTAKTKSCHMMLSISVMATRLSPLTSHVGVGKNDHVPRPVRFYIYLSDTRYPAETTATASEAALFVYNRLSL